MVIRQWIYKTAVENAARFEQFEYKEGLPMMLSQSGCLGVEFFRRRPEEVSEPGIAEYTLLSSWENWELLQAGLASKSWREEVELFLSQGFGEGNGFITHYDKVVKPKI